MSSLTSVMPIRRDSGPGTEGKANDGDGCRLVTNGRAGPCQPALAIHARARLQQLPAALSKGGAESGLVLGCAGQGARHRLVDALRRGDGHLTRRALDQVVSRRAVERIRV